MALSDIKVPTYEEDGTLSDKVEIIINAHSGRMQIKLINTTFEDKLTISTECHFGDISRAWVAVR